MLSCVKVEAVVLGVSIAVRTVSVDVKQHWRRSNQTVSAWDLDIFCEELKSLTVHCTGWFDHLFHLHLVLLLSVSNGVLQDLASLTLFYFSYDYLSWLKGPGFESGRSGGRMFFSRVDFLCRLLFRYPFHPRVTAVARQDPGHSAKSAGGRLQLNTHTPYVCGFAWSDMEHGCMVYIELAPRRLQFHVAPAMPAL